MKESIPERQAQLTKVAEFLTSLPDGEEVSWLRIESDTSVRMDSAGKALVRQALKRIKRPYAPVRGQGLQLSGPSNALTIMHGGFVRIDNAVRSADKTRAQLSTRHLEQLTPPDQQRMLMLAGFFGAVRTYAKEARTKLIR